MRSLLSAIKKGISLKPLLFRRTYSTEVFASQKDIYNGITIKNEEIPNSLERFTNMLSQSMAKWREVIFK